MSLSEIPAVDLERVPAELRDTVNASLLQFSEKLSSQDGELLQANAEFMQSLAKVWTCSQFVANSCLQKPAIIIDLVESGRLFSDQCREGYRHYLDAQDVQSEADLMTVLRRFRRQEMIRIAWRDLAGWADLAETMMDLTALADACIQYALQFLYQQACQRRGTPLLGDGSPQQLIVLGMGKLGAWELNYSSDIDLILSYVQDGILEDRKQTTYNEFFSRLCRSLVKMLDEVTVDGFVFRTDVRLRPFGDSGPIVMSFEGMENYYQTQAREWERYAMIKVRQVAGDFNSGEQLLSMLKPFVYRRYIDYGAFAELRLLKFKITQELQRRDRMDNIKLGPGGIREIEFIGQAFQLIRGGNEKSLQQRSILSVLTALQTLGLLPADVVTELQRSYRFLRRVENHIQQYQDKQTHDLPKGEMERSVLAYSLGYSGWDSFIDELDAVRRQVQGVFDDVFSIGQQDDLDQAGVSIWVGEVEQEVLLAQLGNMGYQHPGESLSLLQAFKNSTALKRLTAKGAAVVDRLMPQLLNGVGMVGNPDQTLRRLLSLLEAVAGRNVYLALLAENPDALPQLINLSSASPWICDYLARYPVLFDELLDTRSLYEPLDKENLQMQLHQQLRNCDHHDLEQIMIVLRKFKQVNVLRVAAADIMDVIPITVVSDYLTYIAEVILEEVVEQAWRMLTEKHGVPPGTTLQRSGRFGVLGFGKLGGLELGYGSDMDLVFLYDCDDGNSMTDGVKPISTVQFYGRLGQKIIHMLSTRMLSGILYEVDMRLRPSGKSGLLVSHVKAYRSYMEKEAWTWEHQALVRGRFVAGDPEVMREFESIRRDILCLKRDVEELKREVREMREKMRDNLASRKAGLFDLKQGQGGIADIEFIVQFSVLALAHDNEKLLAYTDNIRLIDALQEIGFFSRERAEDLKRAYCAYRDRVHAEVLQGNPALVPEEEFRGMRSQIEKIWQEVMQ